MPDIPRVPHPYLGAVSGCWQVYESVLAREYGEFGYPQPTHRLTVDTYAVQHPGEPGRQAIQSVNVHLVSLYLVVEIGLSGPWTTRVLRTLTKRSGRFSWLDPPVPNGTVTILDVAAAGSLDEHAALVNRWARDVWLAWATHHPRVRDLAAGLIG